jgi:hypothetical protein
VESLDDVALLVHLDAWVEHLRAMRTVHHTFNGTWRVPLRDYLAHARSWTGMTPAALMWMLEGACFE